MLVRGERLVLTWIGSAIVEQVKDGTTLRTRLLMPEGHHQIVNIGLAGVRSAKASSKQGEASEPWGEEVRTFNPLLTTTLFNDAKAKFFTESRLLHRPVKVQILSLPSSTATPFQSTTSAPPPASLFIGNGQSNHPHPHSPLLSLTVISITPCWERG